MQLTKWKVVVLSFLVLWALGSVAAWIFRVHESALIKRTRKFSLFPEGLFSLSNYGPTTDKCSPVHVALVVGEEGSSWHEYLTIKSILLHRSTPIHFHFITADRKRVGLQTMLDTWLVPGVSQSYYDLDKVRTLISKQNNSGIQCNEPLSIYLNLHLVLRDSVRHVIAVEPRSVVTVNVAQLVLDTFQTGKAITICSARCAMYCFSKDSVTKPWGAFGVDLYYAQHRNIQIQNLCRQDHERVIFTANSNKSYASFVSIFEDSASSRHPLGICDLVRDYDGNNLRYKNTSQCPTSCLVTVSPPEKDTCAHYEWERATRRRELPFLLGHFYNSSDPRDVTLINHLDYNRLALIERSLINWGGPVSIAIHVTDMQVQEVINFLLKSSVLHNRKNISYHLMFKIGPVYPINPLRELGHRFVSTPHVFYGDIDYVSSYDMYKTVKQNLKNIRNLNKTAVVIPAFETQDTKFVIPETKKAMVSLFWKRKVFQFHYERYSIGHASTNYLKWITATKPYYVTWSESYEPYLLLESSVFSFDTQFLSRFHNKGSHVIELFFAGFKFLVLHNCYIVHLPHQKIINKELSDCSQRWYRQWLRDKIKEYNINDASLNYFHLLL